ncbi:multiheme c-type cytochrome [Geothermobacter hydrogeniphilus]|uniref:Uncharacterized protein n=1 Tax=Geothermobacter hydrogeniphilus TaxID=1969733 RepID=A0A1X0YDT4_9BACT|nr:multiheme c-type cytochrome [Geothermobacter hydrogeniphilus]ORJ63371.1 hypothetical protein B5V00_00465 [Geothermobacter hydrogeniphilus]
MRMLLTLVLLLSAVPVLAADRDCLDCHREETPAAVRQWQQSAHASSGVGCADCHGEDHDLILQGKAVVGAEVCGACHRQALAEHRRSRHGQGLHSGWGCTRNMPDRNSAECGFCHQEGSSLPVSTVHCARFLEQSGEMRQNGCNRCHSVENSCGSCHGNHLTDLALVRDPQVCAKCHMGPDHPQWEMWTASQHGQINKVRGRVDGPDCQSCHLAAGGHDVSRGITVSPGGKPYSEQAVKAERKAMLAVCVSCHARGFAMRELQRGDRIREQARALVDQARAIIEDLNDRGLLRPGPEDRPAHPLRGRTLVLDGQMLYENISHIERLFFKMQKYDFARTWKGAYHQNPDYTHWYGNAELKMDLVDIRSEADRLLNFAEPKTGTAEPGAGQVPGDPTKELERLRKRFDRGGMSDEAYRAEKQHLLDNWSRNK